MVPRSIPRAADSAYGACGSPSTPNGVDPFDTARGVKSVHPRNILAALSDTHGRELPAGEVELPADAVPPRARRVVPLALLAVLAIAAIWLADVSTGPEYGFAIFYLIPIAFAAWFLGRLPGLVVAALATPAWISADIPPPEAIPGSPGGRDGVPPGGLFRPL